MAETPGGEFTTVIGPDAKFDGKLTFEKGLRLQGKLTGEINTPGKLHVTKESEMDANVDAGSIIVEGKVKGNLNASDRVELKASAKYDGNLIASKLVVEEGAVFTGQVSVGPDATKSRPGGGNSPGINRPANAPGQNSGQVVNKPQG